VYQKQSLNQKSSDFDVTEGVGDAIEHSSEPGPQESKGLALRVNSVLVAVLEQNLDSVSDLTVLEIPLHQAVVYLGVSHVSHTFEQNVHGNQELLLLVNKPHFRVSIAQIVNVNTLSK
jgi:hypothetical protein